MVVGKGTSDFCVSAIEFIKREIEGAGNSGVYPGCVFCVTAYFLALFLSLSLFGEMTIKIYSIELDRRPERLLTKIEVVVMTGIACDEALRGVEQRRNSRLCTLDPSDPVFFLSLSFSHYRDIRSRQNDREMIIRLQSEQPLCCVSSTLFFSCSDSQSK